MGDPQFQQFTKHFDLMPQHIRAPQQCYRLVPDIDIDCLKSPENEVINNYDMNCKSNNEVIISNEIKDIQSLKERKRRKLPKIPCNQIPFEGLWQSVSTTDGIPLSEELAKPQVIHYLRQNKCLIRQVSTNVFLEIKTDSNDGKPISLKLYNKDPTLNNGINSSDEDDYRFGSDSGNSSAISPIDDSLTYGNGLVHQNESQKLKSLQLLEATHRGLYKFVPRHSDELKIEIGDPIHLSKENDDLWCEGYNLKTGEKGIFPSALVTDIDYSEFMVDPNCDDSLPLINIKVKKERYLLDFLGSVEVKEQKGNPVLCESVRRVLEAKPSDIGMNTPNPSIVEISDLGLRMTDNKPVPINSSNNHMISHDYFFALKHVTFCGFYPEDNRYFGFITKHPTETRLACHVFKGKESTREVTEAVGRAFHRLYNRFIELSYPIEEFYID
ncbi:JNK-interacting protein 1-like [Oppia nitens]|uniref:JNK-interacting protein 1-like n=1 Tax=Oppia nitens TaxID=1686743 RepID=UPI0023DA0441|nr:JNK-interacting protein 1-like [Oppia nitens]